MQWEAPSKLLAVDDPLLLQEREVQAEIGINWFLDREIPKGGYVRIIVESLLREERRGRQEKELKRASLYAWSCTEGGQLRAAVGFFTKAMVGLRFGEQELITIIQEQTKASKCTEEKEEAGYRSTIWSIIRALQKINSAKRVEGEAVMSAPPFFQSAGRGNLKPRVWGEDDGPTVVAWESLSESEQEQWSKNMIKSKDWVVWCRSS